MNPNGPTEARAYEQFLERLAQQLARFEHTLDSLSYKVSPVVIETPCVVAINNATKDAELQSLLISELYKKSNQLSEIINRLEYIVESIVI